MWAILGGAAQPILSGVNKALTFGRWQAPERLAPERAHLHLSVLRSRVPLARPGTLSCQPPAAAFEQPSTSQAELETAVQRLSTRASDWQALGPTERSSLLQECVLSIKQVEPAAWPYLVAHHADVMHYDLHTEVLPALRDMAALALFDKHVQSGRDTSDKCFLQEAEAGSQAAAKAKGSYNTRYGEEYVGWVPIVWVGMPGGSVNGTAQCAQSVSEAEACICRELASMQKR